MRDWKVGEQSTLSLALLGLEVTLYDTSGRQTRVRIDSISGDEARVTVVSGWEGGKFRSLMLDGSVYTSSHSTP